MTNAQRIADLEQKLSDAAQNLAEALARIDEIEKHLFHVAWHNRLKVRIGKDGK